jgi:hypothetical protein
MGALQLGSRARNGLDQAEGEQCYATVIPPARYQRGRLVIAQTRGPSPAA